ncbi:MAG: PEP-CTERM sorting domain-containing protein [Candidatus Acidiferrum sp.]|jgi:hypothetical protein
MKRVGVVNSVIAIIVTLASGGVLRADTLDVALSQSSQTVDQGTTIVTFDATILNPSATETIFLNADDSSTDSFSVSVDDTPFLLNAPLFLGPSAGSGPFALFNVDLAANLALGMYTGSFSILGGADGGSGTDFFDLADANFSVDVTKPAVTPEPGTLLLLSASLCLLIPRRRRERIA